MEPEASDTPVFDGLFTAVSPYLNAFVSAATDRAVGYVLGEKRTNPALVFGTGSANPQPVADATSWTMYLPWGILLGVGIYAVMLLGRR